MVFLSTTTNAWNDPTSNQYHIQTDEGPERYFRYQTLSGQYRKEKRLEDGTVVGTYAWIDDNGILRQRDYVADNAGYRILKTKNVYVGRNVPVGEAVKSVKKYPAQAGTLVKTNSRPIVPVPTNAYLPSTTIAPIKSITPTPFVEISPNSIPSSTVSPPLFSSTISNYIDVASTTTPASILGSTVSNPSLLLIAPNASYYSTTTQRPTLEYLPSPPPTYLPPASDIYNSLSLQQQAPVINQNTVDFNPYVSQLDNQYVFRNGPTYPIDRRGQTYTGRQNNVYDGQYEQYDGVAVTNDGFRYYIPRAYHEEQQLPGDKKSGSFGYIDPFGIRRVIYYNAAPGTGFQHRKNNRYVGFRATPYDPRPPYE